MIEIAIVEDEESYRNILIEYINKYQQEYHEAIHITIFADGDEITEKYRAGFDIILMDIEMKFMDGMTAATIIRQTDSEVIIIFITNMAQYAIQGYAVDALDYILKPISYFAFGERLKKAIARINRREEKYISIVSKNGVTKIPVSRLVYVESEGHRLSYHVIGEVFESTVKSMKQVEEELAGCNFYRCNKCYLVNLSHVKAIREGWAILTEGQILVSRAKKADFQKALTEYAGAMVR